MRYDVTPANSSEVAPPQQGSIEALDPFSAPVPGQALTERPGKHKFEKPAKYSDPDEGAMYVITKMEEDAQIKEEHLKQLASGVPIEYIVNTITHVGFQEGLWNPDVAELIKPSLALYFVMIAMEEEIPVVMFNPQNGNPGSMSDEDVLLNMSKLNPEGYNILQQRSQQVGQTPEPEGFMAEAPVMEEEPMLETLPEEGMI